MERTDISWIKHDITFHDKRHPVEMRAFEAERFLFYPANDRHVVFNTIRNQAVSHPAYQMIMRYL